MNDLNFVLIEGTLTGDLSVRLTAKGTPLCTFSIASGRSYKGDDGLQKEAGFFGIEAVSKLAEYCHNIGREGSGVRVIGRLKQECWSGDDGKAHSKVFIIADHVEFRPERAKEKGS
jgi:single-strand DNA-binding protein